MDNETDVKAEAKATAKVTDTTAENTQAPPADDRQVKLSVESAPRHEVSVQDVDDLEGSNPHLDEKTLAKTRSEMEAGRAKVQEHKGREAMLAAKKKEQEQEDRRVEKAGRANRDL